MSKLFIVSLLFSLPAWALLNATALASQNEPNYQKALRFLEYRQAQSACKTLTPALSLDNDVCDGNASANFKQKIKSINKQYNDSLSLLGITLRQLGYYDLAGEALEAAQANARTSEEQENISLSLANVNQSNYYRLLAQYRNADEINKKDEALDPLIIAAKNSLSQYEELWNSADNSVKIKSKLNWLILLSSFTSDIPELAELKKQSKFNQVVQDINTDINGLTEQDQIESRLKYAEALRQLAVSDSNFLNASLAQAENALDLSIKAKDSIHSSQAFGLLGKIYLQNLDSQKAEANFAKAQSFALANHSLELAYQWQWELGKIYANRGDARALPQYKAAVDSLNLLRKNLITLNPDSQFGFQEQIEPLYKEYLALLFNQKQPDLKEIIQVNEVVQVTELENYLQCSQLQVSSILNLKAKDSPDAVIYMIRLPHSYELIVRQKNGNLIHRTAKFSVIDTALNNVQQNLSSEKIDNLDSGGFQSLFGELYQASFKLIEDVLPKNGTIVISGDSQLLSIPWGILYDGNHYLIERYSIAYSLGVDTQAPRLLKPGNLNVFAAGISDLSSKPNYSDLEYVPEELQGIKEVVSTHKGLSKSTVHYR